MPPDDEYDAEPASLDDVVKELSSIDSGVNTIAERLVDIEGACVQVVDHLGEIKTELSELGTLGSEIDEIEKRLVDIESASGRVADCLEEIKAELSDLGTTVTALKGELQKGPHTDAVLWVLVVLVGLGIARLYGWL